LFGGNFIMFCKELPNGLAHAIAWCRLPLRGAGRWADLARPAGPGAAIFGLRAIGRVQTARPPEPVSGGA